MNIGMLALVLAAFPRAWAAPAASGSSPDFVRLRDVAPDIIQDIRYAGAHNFVGRPIPGYEAAECLLTRPAARALAEAEDELRPFGLTLKVFDCYRPRRAVAAFAAWAKDAQDRTMKAEFYPRVEKADLFKDGYIAARSAHSRGSTVDLTLAPLKSARGERYRPGDELRDCARGRGRRFADGGLDMGTGFDCFDPRARTDSPAVGRRARADRLLLKLLMEKNGFVNLPEEWWHYTLADEPYKDRDFDAPVR